jgi:hypothetical protein
LPVAAGFFVAGVLDLDADRRGAESRAGSKRADYLGDRGGAAAFYWGAHLLFCGQAETEVGAGDMTEMKKAE